MQSFINSAAEICTQAGGKIILALVVFIIGRIIIGKLMRVVQKLKGFDKLDPTVRSFAVNFVNILLYVILVVSIISILGVPMASVIAVLASAGMAVGLALQGALGNLAGGIMILIFRPFNVGDYISAGGAEGTVREIHLFYTVINTNDNVRITVPNGALMNANVSNFSAENNRRVDLVFSCAKGEDVSKIQDLMLGVMNSDSRILKDPAPFARLSGGTNEAMEFTVRAWTAGANYWDVHFDLTENITGALGAAGVKAPAVRIVKDA